MFFWGRSWSTSVVPDSCDELGVQPIWFLADQSYNGMAAHCLAEQDDAIAAMKWLELAMAADVRRSTPEYAAISCLHLAAILHRLRRHKAAQRLLEAQTTLLSSDSAGLGLPAGRNRAHLQAVCWHNLAVQHLVFNRPELASAHCDRAVAAFR